MYFPYLFCNICLCLTIKWIHLEKGVHIMSANKLRQESEVGKDNTELSCFSKLLFHTPFYIYCGTGNTLSSSLVLQFLCSQGCNFFLKKVHHRRCLSLINFAKYRVFLQSTSLQATIFSFGDTCESCFLWIAKINIVFGSYFY